MNENMALVPQRVTIIPQPADMDFRLRFIANAIVAKVWDDTSFERQKVTYYFNASEDDADIIRLIFKERLTPTEMAWFKRTFKLNRIPIPCEVRIEVEEPMAKVWYRIMFGTMKTLEVIQENQNENNSSHTLPQ